MLDGGVIIGKVVIDNRSTLAESLVLSNTYIGSDLEFIGKIVYRNSVIDPSNDTKVDLQDLQLTGEVPPFRYCHCCLTSLFDWIMAFFLLIFLTVPFFLFLLIGVYPSCIRRIYAGKSKTGLSILSYPDFSGRKKSKRGRLFHFSP